MVLEAFCFREVATRAEETSPAIEARGECVLVDSGTFHLGEAAELEKKIAPHQKRSTPDRGCPRIRHRVRPTFPQTSIREQQLPFPNDPFYATLNDPCPHSHTRNHSHPKTIPPTCVHGAPMDPPTNQHRHPAAIVLQVTTRGDHGCEKQNRQRQVTLVPEQKGKKLSSVLSFAFIPIVDTFFSCVILSGFVD